MWVNVALSRTVLRKKGDRDKLLDLGNLLQVTKLKSRTHKRLKERFLIGRNRTKCSNFRRSSLFEATYNIQTEEKQTIASTYLVSVGCGRLAEAKTAPFNLLCVWDLFLQNACSQLCLRFLSFFLLFTDLCRVIQRNCWPSTILFCQMVFYFTTAT